MVAMPELVANDQIVLTNMKRLFGPPIADHAFGMLLSLIRSLPVYADSMKAAGWPKQGAKDPPLLELRDKTMLVVGLGGIGTEVARRAHAFGMRVIATDAKPMAVPSFVARLETPDKLPVLLPVADVIVLCVPLTGQTKGLIGAAQFSLMKPTAFFIDVARGKEYDNLALAAALKAGRLAGAGLDVTDPEPLPPDHPLWKAPHVIITPHVAGRSPGTDLRRRALMVENMRRFGAGEPLLNVVDKKAGY
jgi:phosphoglycerate dehydrogenase-like enzyme